MPICLRCQMLRPGVNKENGMCVSCAHFAPDWKPTQAAKRAARLPSESDAGRVNWLNRPAASSTYPCPRCRGTGRVAAYMHIDKGRCYACQGSGASECRPVSATLPISSLALPGAILQYMADAPKVPALPSPLAMVSPPEPKTLSKQPVIDAALGDNLSYTQLRAVLDNASRYHFTTEEIELLEDCMHQLVPGIPTIGIVHSGDDWWSRDR